MNRKKEFSSYLKRKTGSPYIILSPRDSDPGARVVYYKKKSSDIPDIPKGKFNLLKWILSKL